MAKTLYNPFSGLDFNFQKCFLTGEPVNFSEEHISVFPEWILDRYSLHDKTFTMLGDGYITKYKELRIPCSRKVIHEVIIPFEKEIEKAFSKGYDEVKKLPEELLFQWMAKLVYGLLYIDLSNALKYHTERNEKFTLSSFLQNKFRNLHLMLQSLNTPMVFKGKKPWSITIARVRYSKDIFNYKDETNKLNFSLGMNGFGVAACLQDNNENAVFHKELTTKIDGRVLHPIQFEELCGRFIYSNYLLTPSLEYSAEATDDKIVVELIPSAVQNKRPLFELWEDEMFAQVLANYWKPWGITMKDIHTFPNSPISFLVNEVTDELIDGENITLPY
jgi:hypothetical protein